jgi:hypothetical protein
MAFTPLVNHNDILGASAYINRWTQKDSRFNFNVLSGNQMIPVMRARAQAAARRRVVHYGWTSKG